MSNDKEIVPHSPNVGLDCLSVDQVAGQVQLIQKVMEAVMEEGEHYGKIPGCGDKPTLLKAGAEKLCLTFRLDPQYETVEKYDGSHLTITSRCILYHIQTGQRLGSGMGSCSTRESKYAYRAGTRKCPKCKSASIIKGKAEYGGGWVCFAKKGGCNAKFQDGDKSIEGQNTDRVPNEDIADQYNTVLKMANKRSLIAGVLNVTAASDIFTQDIEDMDFEAKAAPVAPPAQKPQPQSPKKKEPNFGDSEGPFWKSDWKGKSYIHARIGSTFSREFLVGLGFKDGKNENQMNRLYDADAEDKLLDRVSEVEVLLSEEPGGQG